MMISYLLSYPKADQSVLMSIEHNLISPQNARTSFDLIQDVVMGLYWLSSPQTQFSAEMFMLHWYALRYTDGTPPTIPIADTSGVALLSYLFPPDLFIDAGGASVRNGRWISGRLTKKVAATLIDVIARDYTGRRAVRFMSDAQRLAVSVLFQHGYTCGIRDTMSSTSAVTAEDIQHRLDAIDASSNEATSMREVHRIMDRACGACTLRPHNNFALMTASGAKGSVLNTFQISVAVGQQLIAGVRPGHGGRSLPCFHSSDGPRARGFVASSYEMGLKPSEFFFHAAGGREGLVDTAVKTASTGYITR